MLRVVSEWFRVACLIVVWSDQLHLHVDWSVNICVPILGRLEDNGELQHNTDW